MKYHHFWIISAALSLILLLAVPNSPAFSGEGGLDKKRVDEAAKKGVEFLKTLQKPDGSFSGETEYEKRYAYGSTAFALFALLKGGEPKNSTAIQQGFNWLRSQKGFPGVYGAACLILALSALGDEEDNASAPDESGDKSKGLVTVPVDDPAQEAKDHLKNTPDWAKGWMKEAVEYLIKAKTENVWRYPGPNSGEYAAKMNGVGGNDDASNTQFAIIALYAARRMGIRAPKEMYASIAEYFILNQEDKGPEVQGFPVPGVDLNLKKLEDMEKEWTKEFNKKLKEEIKESKEAGKEYKGMDLNTVPREDPYQEFGKEIGKFSARGWAYLAKNAPKTQSFPDGSTLNTPQIMLDVTGSMTASGVVSCMLAKAELEDTPWYKKNKERLDKAIRDGLAWIVKNWNTSKNPGASQEDSWKYYFFYSVERAGVLTLAQNIGEHDWYKEIGGLILSEQQSNGSWAGGQSAPIENFSVFSHGPMWNTCFAILFLKKSVTPLVKPEVIYTGTTILGGKSGGKDEKKDSGKQEE